MENKERKNKLNASFFYYFYYPFCLSWKTVCISFLSVELIHALVCANVTQCTLGTTFEDIRATATSDRSCQNCSVCPLDTFEKDPCTTTSDRTCTDPCSVCDPHEFELISCTPTTNRKCLNCSACEDGLTYMAAECTTTTDTVCLNCTTCSDDTFEVSHCTIFKNTQCQQVTICGENEIEVVGPTQTSNRQCGPRPPCDDDQFVYSLATPTSDLECRPTTKCSILCSSGFSETGICTCSPFCNTCFFRPETSISSCQLCQSGRYLYDGQCWSSCSNIPDVDGLIGSGSGTIHNTCDTIIPFLSISFPFFETVQHFHRNIVFKN